MTKETFKQVRTQLGLTQKELALLLGVKHETLLKYERGSRNITKTIELLLDHIKRQRLNPTGN